MDTVLMKTFKVMNNKFFIRLSLSMLLVLLLFGSAMTYISFVTTRNYQEEANQKLHAHLAQFTIDHLETFNEEGKLDTTAIQKVMESMMIINPDVEVYLLDTAGGIMAHVAPYKKVVREAVSLEPVKRFIADKGQNFIKGDDPRDFLKSKIFSAAPILQNDVLKGYYYIILVSEERESVFAGLLGTYTMDTFLKLIALAAVLALLLGFFILWYQTKHLQAITDGMGQFHSGDFSTRIETDERSMFSGISETFNDMANQIQLQFDKIKSIDNFRRELVANISHDLRTPLSIIQGFTETLQLKKNELSAVEENQYLENINESTKKLKGLVNQLFELSKLENNQIQLQKEPFPLDELAYDLMARYEVLFKEKNIEMEFVRNPETPLVFGDISLVERVIQNLVDNAIKFTPKGGKIKLEIGSSDTQNILFSISDTGSGIAEKDLSAIFERYHTKTKDETSVKGTGLGLAIANKIIQLHNSTIDVSSKLNQGTRFSFNLPAYVV